MSYRVSLIKHHTAVKPTGGRLCCTVCHPPLWVNSAPDVVTPASLRDVLEMPSKLTHACPSTGNEETGCRIGERLLLSLIRLISHSHIFLLSLIPTLSLILLISLILILLPSLVLLIIPLLPFIVYIFLYFSATFVSPCTIFCRVLTGL